MGVCNVQLSPLRVAQGSRKDLQLLDPWTCVQGERSIVKSGQRNWCACNQLTRKKTHSGLLLEASGQCRRKNHCDGEFPTGGSMIPCSLSRLPCAIGCTWQSPGAQETWTMEWVVRDHLVASHHQGRMADLMAVPQMPNACTVFYQ